MTDLNQVFPAGEELTVTAPGGRVALVFSRIDEKEVPLAIARRCGGVRGLLRAAGSTLADIDEMEQQRLLNFMAGAFQPGNLANLAIMSGGTRLISVDRQVVMGILELPALIRRWHPTCRALGSAPATTETMSLVGQHSTFIPGDNLNSRTLAHPGLDVLWFVLGKASSPLEWNGDVQRYFDLMDLIKLEQGATGLFVWGGGKVTATEIREALLRRHPCGIVANSGRFASSLYAWANNNRPKVEAEFINLLREWTDKGVDPTAIEWFFTPEDVHPWLHRHGFYAA